MTIVSKDDLGHWTTTLEIDPDKYFGFVYLITDKTTGRKYVGKKQYWSYKKTKKFKEMDWRNYKSSSKELVEDIKKFGKDNFIFTIVYQSLSKGVLSYLEAEEQYMQQALVLTEGDQKVFYNKQIAAIKFIPKAEHYWEAKEKANE